MIMVELYGKKLWTDKKVINIIAEQCMSKNVKKKMIAGYFLLETTLP